MPCNPRPPTIPSLPPRQPNVLVGQLTAAPLAPADALRLLAAAAPPLTAVTGRRLAENVAATARPDAVAGAPPPRADDADRTAGAS